MSPPQQSNVDPTGLGLVFGSAEQGLAWVGRKAERRVSDVTINEAMVLNYCALVEDANPNYWQGGECPPGMLMAWLMPVPWKPGGGKRTGLLAMEIPLPGHHIINVSTESEFLERMRVGDRLSVVDEVVEITPEKTTRLGRGHFITTLSTFSNQDGIEIARNKNVLFRYDTEAAK